MKSRRISRNGLLVIPLLSLVAARADCPPCGPLYCLGDPAFASAMARKKQDLRQTYPDRLTKLLDKQGRCMVCVSQGPDAFSLMTVQKNGSYDLRAWSAELEAGAADALRSGSAKEYVIVHSRRICTCCTEKKAEERNDWDAALQLNRSAAISCVWDGGKEKVRCSG